MRLYPMPQLPPGRVAPEERPQLPLPEPGQQPEPVKEEKQEQPKRGVWTITIVEPEEGSR